MPATQRELGDEDWHALLLLAHNNKATAFDRYSKYDPSTSGQLVLVGHAPDEHAPLTTTISGSTSSSAWQIARPR